MLYDIDTALDKVKKLITDRSNEGKSTNIIIRHNQKNCRVGIRELHDINNIECYSERLKWL